MLWEEAREGFEEGSCRSSIAGKKREYVRANWTRPLLTEHGWEEAGGLSR